MFDNVPLVPGSIVEMDGKIYTSMPEIKLSARKWHVWETYESGQRGRWVETSLEKIKELQSKF